MDMQEIALVAGLGLGLGGFVLVLLGWKVSRQRRRAAAGPADATPPSAGLDPVGRRIERRMEEIEAVQTDLAERIAEMAADTGPAKLQATAASLLGLVRDKNAQLDTALAGIEQLRARLKTLESLGDIGEARGLFEGLSGRIEALEAAVRGAAEARAEMQAGAGPLAELGEALTRLHAQKEAAVEAVFARLGPLEAKLGEIEGRMAGLDPRAALDRFADKLEAVRSEMEARIDARIEPRGSAGPEGEEAGTRAIGEIAEALARLYEQKDATLETVFARLAPLEARLVEIAGRTSGLDPQSLFDGFAERLDAARAVMQAQIDGLRAERQADREAEGPFAEIAAALARLAAEREEGEGAESVLARLGPLEARLAEVEGRMRGLDPQAALDRFAERLETVRAGLEGEIGTLRNGSPLAEIAERFARLAEEKDARGEAIFARLAPLEASLAGIEARMAGLDPAAALARLAERLEAAQAGLRSEVGTGLDALRAETRREMAERLDRLAAEKDEAAASVLGRLGPLEARMAELEARMAELAPAAALGRFDERLEAVQARLGALDAVEAHQNALDDMSARLDALDALHARMGALDVMTARMGALDVMAARLGSLESGAETTREAVSAIAAGFARLKERGAKLDAVLATALGRLDPLESRLEAMEASAASGAAEGQVTGAAVAGLAGEIADLRAEIRAELQAEIAATREVVREAAAEVAAETAAGTVSGPLAETAARGEEALRTAEARLVQLSERLAGLQGEREAAVEAILDRLGALERTLGGMEAKVDDLAPQSAVERVEAEVEDLARRVEAHVGSIAGRMDALDPAEALARFAERVEAAERAQAGLAGRLAAMEGAEETAAGAIAMLRAEVAGLSEGRDAALEAAHARLAGLERSLAEIETRDLSEAEARAEAQAIAVQMIAARTVEAETRLFASRLSLLEASLPRLSLAQSLMMQALKRHAVPFEGLPETGGPGLSFPAEAASEPPAAGASPAGLPVTGAPVAAPSVAASAPAIPEATAGSADGAARDPLAPPADTEEGLAEIWRHPRVVSLHLSGG